MFQGYVILVLSACARHNAVEDIIAAQAGAVICGWGVARRVVGARFAINSMKVVCYNVGLLQPILALSLHHKQSSACSPCIRKLPTRLPLLVM